MPSLTRRTFLRRSMAWGAASVAAPSFALSRPLTLREKVGQLFVVSFRGTTPQPDVIALLQRSAFGGVTLFSRNVRTAAQVRSLISALQRAAPRPLLVSVDQEGGPVERIRSGVHTFPSEATYGKLGSTSRVYADAATTARDLRSLGLTLNLAPVVDVLANPSSPIGARSYGSNPQLVAALSAAAVRGYQQNGLGATAKHFIGLGHTSIDSHDSLPTVSLTLDQLERSDLIPFRSAIAAGVSSILVAHVALPRIDPVHRPASLSPPIVTGIIRQRLGFKGVIMTDSLLMGAVPRGQESSAAELALAAGADMFLMVLDVDFPPAVITDAVDRIVSSVQAGRISESRIDASVARIMVLKRQYIRRLPAPV